MENNVQYLQDVDYVHPLVSVINVSPISKDNQIANTLKIININHNKKLIIMLTTIIIIMVRQILKKVNKM